MIAKVTITLEGDLWAEYPDQDPWVGYQFDITLTDKGANEGEWSAPSGALSNSSGYYDWTSRSGQIIAKVKKPEPPGLFDIWKHFPFPTKEDVWAWGRTQVEDICFYLFGAKNHPLKAKDLGSSWVTAFGAKLIPAMDFT